MDRAVDVAGCFRPRRITLISIGSASSLFATANRRCVELDLPQCSQSKSPFLLFLCILSLCYVAPSTLRPFFSPGVHPTIRCTVSLSLFRFSNQVGLLCLVRVVNSNEISTRKYCNDTDGCRILTKRN